MADPTKFIPGYSYSGWQASNPTKPLPAPQVDNDFANVATSIDEIVDAIMDVRRSDGALKNGIVTADSLSEDLLIGLETPVAWETDHRYVVLNTVYITAPGSTQGIYRCIVSHDSEVFADDLAAGYWELIFDFSLSGGDMFKATYDPQGIEADAFDRSNHTGPNVPDAESVGEEQLKPNLELEEKLAAGTPLFNIIRMAIDVRNKGAKPDDEWTEADGSDGSETNNFIAFRDAINEAISEGNGEVLVKGQYAISDTLVVNPAYGGALRLIGDGQTSRIRQKGAGKDLIKMSQSNVVQSSGIYDLALRTMAGAGHVIEVGYGLTQCEFENLFIWQGEGSKSILHGSFDAGGDGNKGIYTCRFRGGTWYAAPGQTAYPFDVVTNGPRFNENIFESITPYYADARPFFRVINIANDSWLTNNKWDHITFQGCEAGGFLLYNMAAPYINAGFWDVEEYHNHLIHLADGGGLGCINAKISNTLRNGGELIGGSHDIFTEDASSTKVENSFPNANASFDWNGNSVYVSGDRLSGEINTARRRYPDGIAARGICNASGAPLAADNFSAITQVSPGRFRFTFLAPMTGTNYNMSYEYSQTGAADPILLSKPVKHTDYVDLLFTDTAGTPYNPPLVGLVVYD